MNRLITIILMALICCWGFMYCSKSHEEQTASKKVEQSLEQQVSSLFKNHCATGSCHRGMYPKKGLNLEPEQFVRATVGVPSKQVPSMKLVEPHMPEQSYLVKKVRGDDDIVDDRMPEEAPPLSAEDIDTIVNWVNDLKPVIASPVK